MASDALRTATLTSPDFWRRAHARREGAIVAPGSDLAAWFERWLPRRPGLSAIEIGALPGGHLLHVGQRFGYACTALDYRPEVRELAPSFEAAGIARHREIEADFLSWTTDERFDVVLSLGFVEHFADPEGVLARHWSLLRPGGTLFVSVPCLTPFQHLARALLYTPEKMRSLLDSHHLPIGHPAALRRAVRDLPGCEVLCAQWGMGARLWMQPGPDLRPARTWLLRPLRAVAALLGRLPGCGLWSPLAVLVARRKEDA